MATDPKSHAESYGLSEDVAADFEAEEGPPLGAHTGRTNTNRRDAETRDLHGKKTLGALRGQVERRR